MKKQIVHIAPHQFAKTVALTLGLLLSPGIPIGILILIAGGESRTSGLIFMAVPFLYSAGWYLWGVILTALYNVISKRFGGIEITVADIETNSELR